MRRSSPRVDALTKRLYPAYLSESDRLHSEIRNYVEGASRVLDLGCGGGRLFPYDYRGVSRRVVGIDLDPALATNAVISDRVFGSVDELPFANDTFDLAFSRYVFEHLPHPQRSLAELTRVLRPGGVCIILTPNLWHYVPTIARLTPAGFHKAYNARMRGRMAEDTFPTLYRANTRGTVRRLAAHVGLEVERIDMIETRPNYLSWSLLPFLVGVAYERVVNSSRLFEGLRVNILAVLKKSVS